VLAVFVLSTSRAKEGGQARRSESRRCERL